MKNLDWIKCEGDNWCHLNSVNLDSKHFNDMKGVYIIWHSGQKAKTVRVGQGIIRDRLKSHREDPQIQEYEQYGLFVTWAAVDDQYRDGIEAYLANILEPVIGKRFPNVIPLSVNLPWEKK